MTQQSRQLLIDAATALFAERGYRQTTFEDIAARSGVSRGSIPWHFGNKEGLLAAVVEHAVDTMRANFDPSAPGPDALDRALRSAAEFTTSPTTGLFVTLLVEAIEPGSQLRQRYADLHHALREQVRLMLAGTELPGGLDAEAVAVIVIGAIMGIHQQWRIAPDAVDLESTYLTLRALLDTSTHR
jgi:TetR/AcrR family acrAB operon transcriptional repressor